MQGDGDRSAAQCDSFSKLCNDTAGHHRRVVMAAQASQSTGHDWAFMQYWCSRLGVPCPISTEPNLPKIHRWCGTAQSSHPASHRRCGWLGHRRGQFRGWGGCDFSAHQRTPHTSTSNRNMTVLAKDVLSPELESSRELQLYPYVGASFMFPSELLTAPSWHLFGWFPER